MQVFRRFWSLLSGQQKKRAIALILLMIVGMLLETLGIGLIVPLIGLLMQDDLPRRHTLIQGLYHQLGEPSQSELVIVALISLITIYGIKNLFLGVLNWKQASFAHDVQSKLSYRLFEIYLTQPYVFHLQRNSAQLIRNVTVEINMLSHTIIAFLLIMTESLVISGIVILLLWVEPIGALVVGCSLGLAGGLFIKLTRSRIVFWGRQRQYHEGMRIQHLQQGIGGVKDVLLLNREHSFLNAYQSHNVANAHVAGMQVGMQHMPRLGLEFLAVVGLVVLVLVMLNGHQGDIANVLPVLGLFAAAAFRLLPSANRMVQSIQTVRFAAPIVNLLHEELQLTPVKSNLQIPAEVQFNHYIELKNLKFSYPGASVPALTCINLQITKGSKVGFVGASGSGKSTLVDLLMGLLEPEQGEVLVDGENIKHSIHSWQSKIGYVPQTIYLTDDSLRRNVAFGIADEQIDDSAVDRAIKAAQLNTFVSSLPDGLETLVGERGVRLSGGQRQRVGIARALYHDPHILVLDEATSALDSSTEADVMLAVDALQDKTIIIVAHRLSTIANCSQVFSIESGRLIEATGFHST